MSRGSLLVLLPVVLSCANPFNLQNSYGDTFDAEFCGGLEALSLSGTQSSCVSGWSVFDMSANFREWTSSLPKSGKEGRRIVKGGLRNKPELGARCAYETDEVVAFVGHMLSFRCCMDASALELHRGNE
ncbi:MAG: hypothetical protein HN348_36050 [Proteobacteria bacterium]|jgi:hypothetical protein|nr:hypothetical protein [Pseudomonadota bacterium]